MPKTKLKIRVCIITLLIFFTYIYNTVQARYMLNKNMQISYSTSDYYFYVTSDITEISSFPATINITAKNNDGTNWTNKDLTYTIGVDNSNYTVTAEGGNTRTLVGGTKQEESYAITINKVGTGTSNSINLTFTVNKPYSDSSSINLKVRPIPEYYGAEVTNYNCPTEGVKWRVFHKDNEGRIYLIADDYITRDQIPVSTAGKKLNDSESYPRAAYFSNILNDYSESNWIRNNTNENAQKWLSKYLAANTNVTNPNTNIKALAYMMDTKQWSQKFVDTTCAEYAIGGPTIELFCESYKVTHPNRWAECTVNEIGYDLKWNDGEYGEYIINGITKDDFNGIYINSNGTGAHYMWLASPSGSGVAYMMRINPEGGNIGRAICANKEMGFRPVVCLKQGCELVKNADGKTYSIECPIPGYYGAEVTNYECPTEGVNWRVFHKDNEGRIYLIADDYIPYESIPKSTSGTALNKDNKSYTGYFNDILNDYTGSAWIRSNTNKNAQKWLNKYLNQNSTNNNMKAVAYMMDTQSWSKFKGDKAEYAIGGPTIELFCESYKVTHPNRYVECDSITSNGYQVKWSDGSYATYIDELTQNDFKSIYIKSNIAKAAGMWLASPSSSNNNRVMIAYYTGRVGNSEYSQENRGFRPIVCLKSGARLVSNGNGTYSIELSIGN